MSATASNIATIVDTIAAVGGTVTGVTSVWGCGTGLVTDPLLTPGKVRPFGANVPSEGAWAVELPGAPTLTCEGVGSVVVVWPVTARLYVRTADLATTRRVLAPFYGAFLDAFASHLLLGGLCEGALITSFTVAGDADWAWLETVVSVRERLLLTMAP